MAYRLLAMDMDGTVLNSRKTISPRTEEAIHTALKNGYEVLFATGRCVSEVQPHLEKFPDMHYVMCLSGAVIFNTRTGENLEFVTLSPELAEQILAAAEKIGAMVVIHAGDHVYVEKKRKGQMAYFGCDCFAALYDECAVWVEDISDVLKIAGDRLHKVNLYCHTVQDWKKAGELLGHLPVSFAQGVPNNYEISPQGVDKGNGLETLSRVTGIPVSEMIAVGDEGNDISMIKVAGLGVAMGNAASAVKDIADVCTADCDHDGVAEVIEKYLFAGEST